MSDYFDTLTDFTPEVRELLRQNARRPRRVLIYDDPLHRFDAADSLDDDR